MKDNILITELKHIISHTAQKTNFIIYGAGDFGISLSRWLQVLFQITPICFWDNDPLKIGTIINNIPVNKPETTPLNSIAILVSTNDYSNVVNTYQSIGYQYNENLFDLHGIGRRTTCDLIDPLLGYSRTEDISGFKVYGDTGLPKIVILGNSCSDWSNGQITSWTEFLHTKICKKLSPVCIYLGALPGYTSTQEVLQLYRDVLTLMPVLVISMSGVNDPSSEHHVSDYFGMSSYTNHLYEKYILPQQPDKRLFLGVKPNRSYADYWVRNMRIMRAICNEFGIKFYAFLQPTLHLSDASYQLSTSETQLLQASFSKDSLTAYERFVSEAGTFLKEEPDFTDLSHLFSGHTGIFHDHCHWNSEGSSILSDIVYAKIESYLSGILFRTDNSKQLE